LTGELPECVRHRRTSTAHTRPLAPILAAICLVTPLFAAAPAFADDTPRVRAVRFGPSMGIPKSQLRAAVGELRGQPASRDRLVQAVLALEAFEAIGGVDVKISEARTGYVDVRFTFDGRRRRVSNVSVTTRPRGRPDRDESWRLQRRIQALQNFALGEGRPFHPYFLRLDRDLVERYYLSRGHRDVRITVERQDESGLAGVVIRVRPGPAYTIANVDLAGTEIDRRKLLARLATQAGADSHPAPEPIEEDRARITKHFCKRGFADAKVSPRVEDLAPGGEDDIPEDAVRVTFDVALGDLHVVDTFRLTGFKLPDDLTKDIAAGKPYCPLTVANAERKVLAYLRDHGHPDATAEPVVRIQDARAARGSPRRVALTLKVASKGLVRVGQIWFDGHEVTEESVIRQLMEIEEGDLFRQSEIDDTVQNLLRSGLFKRVEVRSIEGARGERHLYFALVEREVVSIDLIEQSLTLHNMDVTDFTTDMAVLSKLRAFRGRGQQLTFYAQPDWQGLAFVDRFVARYMLTQLAANRRTANFGEVVDSTWWDAELGVGVKAFRNRFSLVPLYRFEHADTNDVPEDGSIPLSAGAVVLSSVGGQLQVDVNTRDDERVPYLGLELDARYFYGLSQLGSEREFSRLDSTGAIHLPLGTNSRKQHYVLRLAGQYQRLDMVNDEAPPPHLRLNPTIRGYDRVVLVLPHGTGDVEVGGLRAVAASVELRIPLPYARRHAIAPFFDGATISDADALLDNPHTAAGAVYYFSFFGERLEGFVYGVFPFKDTPDREYIGVGVGGNF
jgi:outer membrane protein assembly factor BamA